MGCKDIDILHIHIIHSLKSFALEMISLFFMTLILRSGEIRVWDPKTGIQKGQPLRGHKKWVR